MASPAKVSLQRPKGKPGTGHFPTSATVRCLATQYPKAGPRIDGLGHSTQQGRSRPHLSLLVPPAFNMIKQPVGDKRGWNRIRQYADGQSE